MFRRKALAAVAAAALAFTLAACGGGSSGSTGGSSGSNTTLTLGVIVPATTFAAADMNFANESPYGQAVYDTLLKAAPDGTVGPSLATEWKYNDDKTVLTMTLRSDVTFTDGTKFNADAAAQNLIRFRDGNSPNKSYLAALKDAKAIDDTHLEITLTASDPGLLVHLTQNAGMQESPKAFTAPDIKTNPVGSGPYILDTANTVIGTSYTFNKNANYWNKPDQHYEKLVHQGLQRPDRHAQRGQGQAAQRRQAGQQRRARPGHRRRLQPGHLGAGLVGPDSVRPRRHDEPGARDVKVRQAFNYAFDRPALLQAVAKGHGTVTEQVFPESSAGYDPALDSKYPYDPAKAKALLAEAGYPNGFTLEMPKAGALGASIYNLVAQQLKDIGVTVNYTDSGTNYIADMLTPKYPATVMALQQDADWPADQLRDHPGRDLQSVQVRGSRRSTSWSTQIHDAATEADAGSADQGAEHLHRRAGLVRALVPRRVQLRHRPEHHHGGAGRQRLPVSVELHAEDRLIRH